MLSPSPSKNYFAIGLLFLCSLTLGLRITGLTWGLPSKSLSLATYHPDEAITLYSMERMRQRGDLFPNDALWWGSFHFYFTGAILLGAKTLHLIPAGNRSELKKNLKQVDRLYLIGRLISVMAGLASVVFIGLLGKSLFNQTTGLLASGLLACSPAAIAADHFLKPDSLFFALSLLGLFLTFHWISSPLTTKKAFWLGIVFGLSASSKYTGLLYWPLPILAGWLAGQHRWKAGAAALLGLLAGFILTCPYAIFSFRSFSYYFLSVFSRAAGSEYKPSVSPLSGLYETVTYYLPFATSWITTLLGLTGIVWGAKKLKFLSRLLWIGASLAIFLVITLSHTKNAIYTMPFLPFLILGSAALIAGAARSNKKWGLALAGLTLSVQLAQGTAIARAFTAANPREKASEWLQNHVAPGNSVGIIRSYYWTAPILRTHESPYQVIKGADDRSALDEALLGWKNREIPSYLVLSDPEYQQFLSEPASSPRRQTLEKLLAQFQEVATFSHHPALFGISLWKREPPFDLGYIAPSQHIYQRTTK